MAVGSGIGASLGWGKETTPGTATSITRWGEFNSESLGLSKVTVQGSGLRGGGLYPRAARRAVTGRNAGGDLNLDVAQNGMGLLFNACLGASTSTLLSGSAYQQVHTPAGLIGTSLTVQKLVPELGGTLRAYTYTGCKVASWTLTCTKDTITTLGVTFDGYDESTAVAAGTPSYASSNVFHFLQASLLVGSTVSTSGGVTSVSGGTAISGVKGATITGSNGIRTGSDNRYINGKVEQVQNAWRGLSGTLDMDFVSQADVATLFANDTNTSLKLAFVGTTAISGSNYPTLEVIVPSIFFNGETPKVGGPDVVGLSASFDGLDNGLGDPVVQVRTITSDTSVS